MSYSCLFSGLCIESTRAYFYVTFIGFSTKTIEYQYFLKLGNVHSFGNLAQC